MALNSSYKRKDELYKEHLATIKGLKFTFREIDILACILHNRGEKKIASLLSISPRTVSAHVYNVMNKLAYNSKDQIIDFIESSGKLLLFREYYLYLLLNSNFEKQLTYIANRINRNETTCYCYRNDVRALDNNLYQSIQKHLKRAHIKLIEIGQDEKSGPIFELRNISEVGYYRDLLKNILAALNSPQTEQILGEFDDTYQKIENIYEGKAEDTDEENQNRKENSAFFSINTILKKRNLVIFSCLLFLLILAGGSLINLTMNSLTSDDNIKKNTLITEGPKAIKNLEEFLKTIKNLDFSADNSHPDKIKKNQSLVKKIEKLLEYNKTKEAENYLSKAEMSAEILTQYLYNLQALATYYMYNMQDGERAEEILLHAKDLAEQYVNIRGKINNDFSELKNEEVLTELDIVKDLPQIYTRIIYSLGRTYIYKKNAIKGKKYFEQAEYLGNKLGLFEGYMSKINGLLVIEEKLADSYIKEDKVDSAIKYLLHIADSSIVLSDDNKNYIADYNPGTTEQKTIIPKENLYNLTICATRIIGAYSKLIQIKKDEKEIQRYIAKINKYLQVDGNTDSGFLKLINQIPNEKLANLCNKLGNLILILWQCTNIQDLNVDDIRLKQIIVTNLLGRINHDDKKDLIHDNLALAEKLFTLAREKSRNTDYTKADSYKGLIATYQLMLNHTHGLFDSKRQDLKDQINTLEKKISLTNSTSHVLK